MTTTFSLILCAALGVVGTRSSILVPEYQAGSLYHGYGKEYASNYHNYEPRSYAFEYGVSDPHTGDHKTQWETKDKDGTVRGSYSLLDSDGTTRIVDYIADDQGFRAVVKKVGAHGTSVETHGLDHPEHNVQPVALASTVEPHSTIIEQPIDYKSYDGGYQAYSDLKPVVADVFTKPEEYVQAPKVEGLLVKVPEHQEHIEHHQHIPESHSLPEIYHRQAEQYKVALPEEYYSAPQHHYVPEEYHHESSAPLVSVQSHDDHHHLASGVKSVPQYVLPALEQYHQGPVEVSHSYEVPKGYIPHPEVVHHHENHHDGPKSDAVLLESSKLNFQGPVEVSDSYEVPQGYIHHPEVAHHHETYHDGPNSDAVLLESSKYSHEENPGQNLNHYVPEQSLSVLPIDHHAQYQLNLNYH
ncbi:uncharacterized protein LOC115881999 [Sitophilus oryzae]|uniref:Uncharacterized protein LOC115881999 n=1 Tax=Sitophilus oryzae TaxID=7048 RepID=A0A6J2XYC4_SITOR|nr:uncharacterized protein LOC115881999 [Sitophilus oryzae]